MTELAWQLYCKSAQGSMDQRDQPSQLSEDHIAHFEKDADQLRINRLTKSLESLVPKQRFKGDILKYDGYYYEFNWDARTVYKVVGTERYEVLEEIGTFGLRELTVYTSKEVCENLLYNNHLRSIAEDIFKDMNESII